jgi:hypothetical protein
LSARWIGDQNNPNRDLSDPTWISREGAHAMNKQRINQYSTSLFTFNHSKCGTALSMATRKESRENNCSKCGKPFSEEN